MHKTLLNLSKFHYELGLIDYDEFNERINVALWLSDKLEVDPRDNTKSQEQNERNSEQGDEIIVSKIDTKSKNNENWLGFRPE